MWFRNLHQFALDAVVEKIQAGASVNGQDDRGYTALIWSAIKGEVEIVRFLIGKGADLDITDNYGQTALYFACVNRHEKIAELLIAAGADLGQKARADVLLAADAQPVDSVKKLTPAEQQSKSADSGLYEEQLPCGGRLQVSAETWRIQYYFPGPDRRYNGTFVTISGADIRRHIEALQEAWGEYEKLRVVIPANAGFTKTMRMGKVVRIGGTAPGVYFNSMHMRVASKQQLESLVASYEYTAEQVNKIQALLGAITRQ